MGDRTSQERTHHDGNQTARGYLAMPEHGEGPAVLVLHAWWGLNDTMRAVCTRLAEAGFVAFAPDLYHGKVADTIADAETLVKALDSNQATADIADATRFLNARPGQADRGLALIGFSLGASYALDLAAADPEHIRAVVLFYGTCSGYLPHPVVLCGRMRLMDCDTISHGNLASSTYDSRPFLRHCGHWHRYHEEYRRVDVSSHIRVVVLVKHVVATASIHRHVYSRPYGLAGMKRHQVRFGRTCAAGPGLKRRTQPSRSSPWRPHHYDSHIYSIYVTERDRVGLHDSLECSTPSC